MIRWAQVLDFLTGVAFKVYERIIEKKLTPKTENEMDNTRLGLEREGRVEWIFVVRQTAEKIVAANKKLQVCVIELISV